MVEGVRDSDLSKGIGHFPAPVRVRSATSRWPRTG